MSSTACPNLARDNEHKAHQVDRPRAPSWKRAALVAVLAVVVWLVFYLRATKPMPKIVYATRYSKEFKYRPAASPIITERLKDGRIRLRGALPTR